MHGFDTGTLESKDELEYTVSYVVDADASRKDPAADLVNLERESDWPINAQINEARGGAHIAFGMGINGAHTGFVGTDIEVESW